MAMIASHTSEMDFFAPNRVLETPRQARNDLRRLSQGKPTRSELSAREEERLLIAAFAHHAHLAPAMDKLLDDLELMDESRRSAARRELPLGDPMRNQRVEDLLMEAVVRSQPNSDQAIGRLLADACGDAATFGEEEAELQARLEFEMRIDGDCDGMG